VKCSTKASISARQWFNKGDGDMVTQYEIEERLKRLNERIGHLIPPQNTWTPSDEAVFKPVDLLAVPREEAQAMRFKAVRYAFTRHYTLNRFYHTYCDRMGVAPDDLKTDDDLAKIPLIPDVTFKAHPSGEEFAHWIADIYTGDVPAVNIPSANASFDDVINAYNAAGLVVSYSTGTSGRHSVIPRDERNFYTFQYAAAKLGMSMRDGTADDHSLSLFPRPTNANLGAARATEIADLLNKDNSYGLDFKITAEVTSKAMSGARRQESAQQFVEEQMRQVLQNGIKWLYRYERSTDRIAVLTPPVLFAACMDILEQQEKRFEFGERAWILTVGGWKTRENERIPSEDFRRRVTNILGIPEINVLDYYGMIEMNASFQTCPEGHYYHLPYTHLKPFVLDSDLEPVGYGELGRFAFLDPLANTYPGFIMSGDEVRLLEQCPACDRLGPVLDHAIGRLSSEEMRGCAAQVRAALEQDLRGA
jgi:long-chain-fatty-acid---luciferin-component ligase